MEKTESKGSDGRYHFKSLDNGFIVSGEDRETVRAEFKPFYIELSGGQDNQSKFGFYEYYAFSKSIAIRLMSNWNPEFGDKKKRWKGCKTWAIKQTAGCIGKRVYTEWQRRLKEDIDPQVLSAQKTIYAAAIGRNPRSRFMLTEEDDIFLEWLFTKEYIVRDIIQYRPAAALFVIVPNLAIESRQLEERKKDIFSNWHNFYSDTGISYTSLNKTLSHFPTVIPPRLVFELCKAHLRRPIIDRTELLFYLVCVKKIREKSRRKSDKPDFHFLHYSSKAEIKTAMGMIGDYMRRKDLSIRRTKDIKEMIGIILDFPDFREHTGGIVGLAKKSIKWHKQDRHNHILKTVERLGGDTETAIPPIPLPEVEGVKFLSTVQAVCTEAEMMQNCLAGYAGKAVEGACYLFSAGRNGDQVNIEINQRGQVVQVHGFRNQTNDSINWITKVLEKWGNQFPQIADNDLILVAHEPIEFDGEFEAPF